MGDVVRRNTRGHWPSRSVVRLLSLPFRWPSLLLVLVTKLIFLSWCNFSGVTFPFFKTFSFYRHLVRTHRWLSGGSLLYRQLRTNRAPVVLTSCISLFLMCPPLRGCKSRSVLGRRQTCASSGAIRPGQVLKDTNEQVLPSNKLALALSSPTMCLRSNNTRSWRRVASRLSPPCFAVEIEFGQS